VTLVALALDVGLEHHSCAHCVLSELCDVHGGLDCASQFQLVGFDRDNLEEWHRSDKFLGVLVVQAVVFNAPSGALDVQALDVGSLLESRSDFGGVLHLGYACEHG